MKSSIKIKESILAQAQVICLGVDFSEVGLDKHVMDGRIMDIPEEEDGEANPESDLADTKADP